MRPHFWHVRWVPPGGTSSLPLQQSGLGTHSGSRGIKATVSCSAQVAGASRCPPKPEILVIVISLGFRRTNGRRRSNPANLAVGIELRMSSLAVDIQEARAHSAKVSEEALTVDLVDGRTIIAPLVWFPRLWHGTPRERSHLEIVGEGAYIHWPDLDEDLTVTGLLAGRQSGESPESLRKWLASRKPRHKSRASKRPSNKRMQPRRQTPA
jgi:uncharacterized protein DUF2442